MTYCVLCGARVPNPSPARCARCTRAVTLVLEVLAAELVAGIYEAIALEIRDAAPPIVRLAPSSSRR